MANTSADSRCLSCGQLCAAPVKDESFHCGRCWTMVRAGVCVKGHRIAWPVFNPQTPCIYCSGKASMDGTLRVATTVSDAHSAAS